MDKFYEDNLAEILARVEAQPAHLLDLTYLIDGEGENARYCPAGLIPSLPHFQALGVFRDPRTGSPCMPGPQRRMMELDEMLAHLFGSHAGEPAYFLLFSAYGHGRWDAQYLSWFSVPPSHKQLALARLYYVREIMRGLAEPVPPGPMPSAAIRKALELPEENSVAAYQRANLQALLSALEGFVGDLQPPEPASTPASPELWRAENTLAGFVAQVPYFQALGVVRGDAGWPAMRGADGATLGPCETLDYLFGVFEGKRASEVLFGQSADWLAVLLAWDIALAQTLPANFGEKQLAMARLRHALQLHEAESTIAV